MEMHEITEFAAFQLEGNLRMSSGDHAARTPQRNARPCGHLGIRGSHAIHREKSSNRGASRYSPTETFPGTFSHPDVLIHTLVVVRRSLLTDAPGLLCDNELHSVKASGLYEAEMKGNTKSTGYLEILQKSLSFVCFRGDLCARIMGRK